MKIAFLVGALALAGFCAAYAAESPRDANERGYRECDLKHLSSCQNTNQLIWSLPPTHHRKMDFDRALRQFLRGAPRIHFEQYSWSAATVALESLTGPGDLPLRFPTGEWFFWGFTPHAAPDQAAIIFDATGHILLIATLGPDMSVPPKGAYGGYPQKMTIYLHTPAPDRKFIEHVVRWARDSVSERNKTYPRLPSDEMGTIKIVTASKDQQQWNARVLE